MNGATTTQPFTKPTKIARKIVTPDEALVIAKNTISSLKKELLLANRQISDQASELVTAKRLVDDAENALVAICTLIKIDPSELGTAAKLPGVLEGFLQQQFQGHRKSVQTITDERNALSRENEVLEERISDLEKENDQLSEDLKQLQELPARPSTVPIVSQFGKK